MLNLRECINNYSVIVMRENTKGEEMQKPSKEIQVGPSLKQELPQMYKVKTLSISAS